MKLTRVPSSAAHRSFYLKARLVPCTPSSLLGASVPDRTFFVPVSVTPVQNMAGQLNPPKTVENDDGSLSAPIVYASVLMGMITVWGKRNQAKQASGVEGSRDEPVWAGAKAAASRRMSWDERVSARKNPAKSES